jgi:hypothetical protein
MSGRGLARFENELRRIYDELRGIHWTSLSFRIVDITQAAIEVELLDGRFLSTAGSRMTWRREPE